MGRLVERVVTVRDEQPCDGCPRWLHAKHRAVEDRVTRKRYCNAACAARTIQQATAARRA